MRAKELPLPIHKLEVLPSVTELSLQHILLSLTASLGRRAAQQCSSKAGSNRPTDTHTGQMLFQCFTQTDSCKLHNSRGSYCGLSYL